MAITENIDEYFVLRGRQVVLCGTSMSTAPDGFINLQGGSTLAAIPFAITQGDTNGDNNFVVWSTSRSRAIKMVTKSDLYEYVILTKDNLLYGLTYGSENPVDIPSAGVTALTKEKFGGYDLKAITDQNNGNLFGLGEKNRMYVIGTTRAELPVRFIGALDFGTNEQAEFILKRGGSMFTMTSRGLYRIPTAEGTFPAEDAAEGTTIGVEFLGESFRCIPNTQFWIGGEFIDDESSPFGTT